MKFKINSIILILMIVFYITPVFGKEMLQGYSLVVCNEKFEMHYNENTAEVALKNLDTKEIWYTNPMGIDEDDAIINANKMRLHSQLAIEVVNQKGMPEVGNSYLDCVKNGDFTYEVKDKKLFVYYDFKKYDLQIPLVYELIPDGLKVSVESDSIIEKGDNYQLTKVGITPYLGAAPRGEEGYLFVPDGCGAIMEFDKYSINHVYNSKVYGKDLSLANDKAPNKQERIMLPVFGMKRAQNGLLAIITEGEEYASIIAQQALPTVGYNYVYAEFETRVIDYYYLDEKDPGRQRKVPYIAPNIKPNQVYAVEYNVLDEAHNSYVGMAEIYQEYLVENKLLPEAKKEAAPIINIDMFGGVQVDGVVLGIPVKQFTTLTTFEQCQEIVEDLLNEGLQKINVRYKAWEKEGLTPIGVTNKIEVASKLGGKKGKAKLIDELNQKQVPVYFEYDWVNYATGNNYIFDIQKAIKNAGNYYAYQYTYNLPTKNISDSAQSTLLMKPSEVVRRVDKISKNLDANVSMSGMGNLVYHDTHKAGGTIGATIDTFQGQLDKISEGRSMLLDAPNMYALKEADIAVNIPVYSSNYINFTRDVPFYQMVVSGYVHSFATYANRTSNPTEIVLKAIECGSGLNFASSYADPAILLNTEYNGLNVSKYESWKKTAVEGYNAIEQVRQAVEGSKISAHDEISKDVVLVEYTNQTQIIINYTNEDVTYDNNVIKAKDYLMLNDEGR